MELESKRQEAIQILLKQGQLPTSEKIAEILGKYDVPTLPATSQTRKPGIEILKSYTYNPGKIKTQDFIDLFRTRYQVLKNLLLNRAEARDAVSISYAKTKSDKGKTTVIAMISDIQKLSTGTIKLVLEDMSGKINAIISKNNKDLTEEASFLCLDEVAAFSGSCVRDTFFINNLVHPDIPIKTTTLSKEDVCVAFTSDLHVGSDMFLPNKFQKFLNWLNGKEGTEKQKEIAQKTKYIFIMGDIVDGVGIYPDQNKELNILDIYEQYHQAYEFISQIPEDKQIIMCGGNHDTMRLAEPQPVISQKFAPELCEMKNITMVSNPAVVRVHHVDDYIGLKVRMYHGYSFTYYLDKIEGLRLAGGFERPDHLMKYLLRRRHLAPSYGSTLALPMKEDPLLIYEIPDVLATGHLHKAVIAKYKSVVTIAGSCWQNNTSFQDKVGLKAEPAKVPILSLKTGKATIMGFD